MCKKISKDNLKVALMATGFFLVLTVLFVVFLSETSDQISQNGQKFHDENLDLSHEISKN